MLKEYIENVQKQIDSAGLDKRQLKVANAMLDLAKNSQCPFCKAKIIRRKLRDALSRKEFDMSGLCQSCQNDAFDEKGFDPVGRQKGE